MKNILIVNGPNLNLLGTREPEIYGTLTFEQYFEQLKQLFPSINLEYFQSNVEGEIINTLHQFKHYDGIVINAAGYSHTSVAIADAISAIQVPTIEVHISNIYSRESYRHQSIIATKCIGSICGLGLNGYQLAIQHLIALK